MRGCGKCFKYLRKVVPNALTHCELCQIDPNASYPNVNPTELQQKCPTPNQGELIDN